MNRNSLNKVIHWLWHSLQYWSALPLHHWIYSIDIPNTLFSLLYIYIFLFSHYLSLQTYISNIYLYWVNMIAISTTICIRDWISFSVLPVIYYEFKEKIGFCCRKNIRSFHELLNSRKKNSFNLYSILNIFLN